MQVKIWELLSPFLVALGTKWALRGLMMTSCKSCQHQLELAVERLQHEKDMEGFKYENLIRVMQQKWNNETTQHLAAITHLEQENRRLTAALKRGKKKSQSNILFHQL